MVIVDDDEQLGGESVGIQKQGEEDDMEEKEEADEEDAAEEEEEDIMEETPVGMYWKCANWTLHTLSSASRISGWCVYFSNSDEVEKPFVCAAAPTATEIGLLAEGMSAIRINHLFF